MNFQNVNCIQNHTQKSPTSCASSRASRFWENECKLMAKRTHLFLVKGTTQRNCNLK